MILNYHIQADGQYRSVLDDPTKTETDIVPQALTDVRTRYTECE
jgi:hypothetical protein